MKKFRKGLRQFLLERFVNFYTPFWGAGIKVKFADKKQMKIDVSMNLTPLNRNYVGTHFGGSLYSMCDPFYVLILIKRLGDDYIVWDKAASIQFKRPGRGRVHARFEVSDEEIERIRKEADTQKKTEPVFHVDVVDGAGEVIATVEKTLYVRRKDRSVK